MHYRGTGDSKFNLMNDSTTEINTLISPADSFIGKLYRAATQIQPAQFRRWALSELRELLCFDAAIWSNGHVDNQRFYSHTLVNLDDALPQELADSIAINPIAQMVIANPGKAISNQDVVPDEDFYQSTIYKKRFQPRGIEQVLSSVHQDQRSGLFTLLTLYRMDRNAPFTEQEKSLQQRVLYHLLNASSHAFFTHLQQAKHAHSARALCDSGSVLHEVQPLFIDLLAQHALSVDEMPFDFSTTGIQVSDCGLSGEVTPLNDLFVVEIWPTGPLDHLTEREKQVVLAVTQGKTFKEVGRELGVSASTVSNHLYRVYQKLSINSRSELAHLVSHGDREASMTRN